MLVVILRHPAKSFQTFRGASLPLRELHTKRYCVACSRKGYGKCSIAQMCKASWQGVSLSSPHWNCGILFFFFYLKQHLVLIFTNFFCDRNWLQLVFCSEKSGKFQLYPFPSALPQTFPIWECRSSTGSSRLKLLLSR